ncbi:hypothetical protein [Pectobacterium aroidearum]|nr:hypothetical protein [Pectobacterium aroidearum]
MLRLNVGEWLANEVVTVATFDTHKSVMVQVYSSPYIEPLSAK